jgi:hypothetical protein
MKIYLAGCECIDFLHLAKEVKCKHYLYTAWAYLSKNYKINCIGVHNIDGQYTFNLVKKWDCKSILDSGLYTLMFGNHKLIIDKNMIENYQHSYIRLIKENNISSIIVECDCQNLVGTEIAWKLRLELKEALPNNQIINVIHKFDGVKELDRMIEYADYIAMGYPEHKHYDPKNCKNNITRLAHYIKNKKPQIKIHLLGCTDEEVLKRNLFCTSADSTTWQQCVRYARHKNRDMYTLSDKIFNDTKKRVLELNEEIGLKNKSENYIRWMVWLLVSAKLTMQEYKKLYGSQEV